ncbi:MAG TPA: hypothetical protein VHQ67_06370 [Nitrospiraceae bacterium]|nr:hypothetical protein [Nitrospiraceae bacterium]
MERPSLARNQTGLFLTLTVFTITTIGVWSGCAEKAGSQVRTLSEEGLNVVRIENNPDRPQQNTHPVSLSPGEVATILRGIRTWEDRNVFHRLVSGDPAKTRAFRDEEISFLAPALSKALAQAGPSDRIYFHLSHVTETGEQETTSGWLYVRDPILYLVLSEVHDRHGPGPDISKYDRRMPDVPEQSGAFKVSFEPEQYLEGVSSRGGWFSADQREELRIRYRDALPALHRLDERDRTPSPSPSSRD